LLYETQKSAYNLSLWLELNPGLARPVGEEPGEKELRETRRGGRREILFGLAVTH
jgi:hypothetical protein